MYLVQCWPNPGTYIAFSSTLRMLDTWPDCYRKSLPCSFENIMRCHARASGLSRLAFQQLIVLCMPTGGLRTGGLYGLRSLRDHAADSRSSGASIECRFCPSALRPLLRPSCSFVFLNLLLARLSVSFLMILPTPNSRRFGLLRPNDFMVTCTQSARWCPRPPGSPRRWFGPSKYLSFSRCRSSRWCR